MVRIYYILSHANSLVSIQPHTQKNQSGQDYCLITSHHSLVPVILENIHELIPVFPVLHKIDPNSPYTIYK